MMNEVNTKANNNNEANEVEENDFWGMFNIDLTKVDWTKTEKTVVFGKTNRYRGGYAY